MAVYAEVPLCAEAKQELARQGNKTGHLRVRAICLPSPHTGGELSLATVGANARRAVEDSTAVGYIGEPNPVAARFSRPILEAAGIAQLSGRSGRAAMAKLLRAIRHAGGSGSLRESVRNELR